MSRTRHLTQQQCRTGNLPHRQRHPTTLTRDRDFVWQGLGERPANAGNRWGTKAGVPGGGYKKVRKLWYAP